MEYNLKFSIEMISPLKLSLCIFVMFYVLEISAEEANDVRTNECDHVCNDLPENDVDPVCMMFSRYKKGYQFFVNQCHARRTICKEDLRNPMQLKEWKSKNTNTFQRALRITVVLGQVFSLVPVVGIASADANKVKFVKTSWKCLYALLSLMGQTFMFILCFIKLVKSVATFNGTSPLIFYVTSSMSMVNFMRIAQWWPPLVQQIARTEEVDPYYNINLTRKCNLTCAVVLILALMEHILSILNAVSGFMACLSNKPLHEQFVTYFYPWVFNVLPYSPLLGVMVQFLHFQSTFVWNFCDLFVINVSYYLASRLEQVNSKVQSAHGKYLPEVFWRATREDYCRAAQLVRKADDVISGVIFISFANNLFFICLQLFNTLDGNFRETAQCRSKRKITGPLGGQEGTAYFAFSLIFLLSRSVAVSLIASQVNTASTAPAPVLYDVPSPVYCVEVQRFLDQINGEKVALSGLKFFKVTRGLILSVAGTIVTYELVMVQLNAPSPASFLMNSTMVPANRT